MTKKLLITLSILTLFASCGTRSGNNSATHDEGVVINGIRWATRNVDMPGTFAETPESAGGFFTWYEAQNACPQGWRVPTQDEFQLLIDTGYEWTTRNNVIGGLFGSGRNQVFLPAARSKLNRELDYKFYYEFGYEFDPAYTFGLYWSSTADWGYGRRRLVFYKFGNNLRSDVWGEGFSVRCVAK